MGRNKPTRSEAAAPVIGLVELGCPANKSGLPVVAKVASVPSMKPGLSRSKMEWAQPSIRVLNRSGAKPGSRSSHSTVRPGVILRDGLLAALDTPVVPRAERARDVTRSHDLVLNFPSPSQARAHAPDRRPAPAGLSGGEEAGGPGAAPGLFFMPPVSPFGVAAAGADTLCRRAASPTRSPATFASRPQSLACGVSCGRPPAAERTPATRGCRAPPSRPPG